MWITISEFRLPPDMLAMRTAGPKWNRAKLYGFFAASWFFLWKTVKIRKGNLSLLPNGPVYAVIFVNDSTNMNQKDGHWAMTGSVFLHLMRNRDDLCIVVKWGAQKEHNHSFLVQLFSSVAQIICSAFLFVISRHLMLNDAIHRQFQRLNNSLTTKNILCWLVKPANSVYLRTALSGQ